MNTRFLPTRVSSFRRLDWLVVLENGRVAAQGRPSELVGVHPLLRELGRREKLLDMDLLQ